MMLTEHIIPSTNQLEIEYESALKTYLARGGEDALQQAYEFGRSAVFAGLGILDVAEIHHRAISAILLNRPPEEMAQGVKNAMIFFEESVSPFEIRHRGYRKSAD